MTLEIGDWRWRSEMIFCFRPEEPAAPVLTSPADSLRDSRYGPRRGRTQQAGAAPHGLGADAPQEDHYSGLAAPPSEMCRRKIGDDAAVKASLRVEPVNQHADERLPRRQIRRCQGRCNRNTEI